MIRVITGPPCGGKSTYVKEHAKAGDLIVDFDDLVEAFGGKRYEADGLIREAAVEARKSAINAACGSESTAWIIDTVHADPFEEDEEVIVIDPGFDACMERAKADGRPQSTFKGIEKWYSGRKGKKMNHLYQSGRRSRHYQRLLLHIRSDPGQLRRYRCSGSVHRHDQG